MGTIDVDINGALQTGELRTDAGEMLDIAAWGIAAEVGWRPHDTLRLAMRMDAASGDSEADDGKLETFDLPYPSNAYLSDACIFMPRNGHDLQFLASIRPFEGLQLTVGSQFMWRMETSDAIYAPGGAVVLDPGGSARALATQLYGRVHWTIGEAFIVQASYVRADPRRALQERGRDEALGFAYASITYRF